MKMHELTRQFLAVAVALVIGAVAISWGYFSIDAVHSMSLPERLVPLTMATLFSCSLLVTAMALVRSRDDWG